MHLLVFSWFYPPYLSAGASRVGQLAKYLARIGMRVSVVTARPRDLPLLSDIEATGEIHYAGHLEVNALPHLVLGRTSIVRNGYELSRLGRLSILGRAYKQVVHFPDPNVGWILPAVRLAATLERPDVVLSSAPPASAHIAAALFSRRLDVPWIAEYRSPWTDNPYFRRWWGTRRLERALERRALARAAAVSAISRHLADKLATKLSRPVDHIPNGYDPDDFKGQKLVEPGLFVHLGSVYVPYPTQLLLDALRAPHRPVRVVFAGRNLADLPDRIYASNAERLVELPGPLPRSEALDLVRRAEANIIFLSAGPEDPRNFTDVPQKLYEYIAAGRPILAIGPRSSETADILHASGLATFANNTDEVRAGLEHVAPRSMDPAILDDHSYPRIAARFADVFASVTGPLAERTA